SVNAGKVLGVAETKFFNFESVASDESCREATTKLTEVAAAFDPEEIYTLHPELDRHASHRAAGAICVDALKQISDHNIKLWAYEVWGLFAKWDRFEDITDHIEKKLAAVAEHRSQIAAVPYGDGIVGLNRWRAVFADPHQSAVQAQYAEVFIKLN
ncbi:MAG: PIG-L deacetylase family protein, partial [Pyrinomonadaceae bacterium]